MATKRRIEMNPRVMMGKPVIRGTRITVELVLRKLSEGATIEGVVVAYPQLKKEDVAACIAYAADTVAHETTRTTIYIPRHDAVITREGGCRAA